MNTVQVGMPLTQVETREYNLAILIILLFLCWPVALIYYFSQPKIIRYEGPAPQQYQAYAPAVKYCPQCGTMMPVDAHFCPHCGKQF